MISSILLLLGLIFIYHCQCTALLYSEINDPISDKALFQVALNEIEFHEFLCGGALFNPFYILTAATCVWGYNAEDDRIRVFTDTSDIHRTRHGRNNRRINKIILHEQFDSDKKHDIALIKLFLPILPSPYIGYALLPRQDANIKKPARIFKFGRQTSDSIELIQININIVNQEQCREKYKSISYNISENEVICARNKSLYMACVGSLGFPLVDERNRIVGIQATFPIPCRALRRTDFPSVFLRVSSYIDWIDYQLFLSERYNPPIL